MLSFNISLSIFLVLILLIKVCNGTSPNNQSSHGLKLESYFGEDIYSQVYLIADKI